MAAWLCVSCVGEGEWSWLWTDFHRISSSSGSGVSQTWGITPTFGLMGYGVGRGQACTITRSWAVGGREGERVDLQ